MLVDLLRSPTALSHSVVLCRRLELIRTRHDRRDWVVKRRERTRHLIELGGLVAKAGLVELTDDDRATLYGAMLHLGTILRGQEREQALTLWRRRGRRAFEDESTLG